MFRRLLTIFSFILFLSAGFTTQAYFNQGKPAGFVNDFAKILSTEEASMLENKLAQFSESSNNEISVVTVKNLEGDTIENFAVKLFEEWGIGKEKEDNGVLLLIAIGDRQMRIEVGYGLEGALPDAISNQIITKTLRPAFQTNNYYQGISDAVDQIIAATKGEYQAESAASADSSAGFNWKKLGFDAWFFLLIFVFYLLASLRRYLAKSRSWWQGGVLGAILGFIIALIFLRALFYFIVLPAVFIVFGLIFDYLVSRVFPQPKLPRRGRGGGFWFWGGGSGGSGGGFGGFGGGGSGGGGSSGSW